MLATLYGCETEEHKQLVRDYENAVSYRKKLDKLYESRQDSIYIYN